MRLVQPRLTALGGVQKAGHSRRPHFRHAHLDEAGPNGGVEYQSDRCAQRFRRTIISRRLAARKARCFRSTSRRTPICTRRTISKARRAPGQGKSDSTERHRRRRARRGGLQHGSALLRSEGRVHGHLGFAERELDRRDQARARRDGANPERIADRHDADRSPTTRPLTSTTPSTKS